MTRTVFEEPEFSEISIELKSLRKIKIAFDKTKRNTLIAQLLHSNNKPQLKDAIMVECKTEHLDVIGLSNSIKTIIQIDEITKKI